MDSVCLIGGSGFVGRHLAARLVSAGWRVRVATRDPESAKALLVLPTVDVVRTGAGGPVDLARAFDGVDAVVNLVGILHGNEAAFRRAHAELVQRVVNACREAGVKRFAQVSALGASSSAPSLYLKSKAEGERIALGSRLDVRVFRPSVVFGEDDSFLNMFARLLSLFPAIPLACADARFQPVWVGDLVRAIADSLDDPSASGKIFPVCGPRVFTLRELVELVGRATGHPRPIVPLGDGLAYLQAAVMEMLPAPLVSRDNLRSMSVANVCDCDFESQFGFAPTDVESIAPGWLAPDGKHAKLDEFRARAGR